MTIDPTLETTLDLVDRSREGDNAARNRLIQRYLPLLTRWAHGRLPRSTRDLSETADWCKSPCCVRFRICRRLMCKAPELFSDTSDTS